MLPSINFLNIDIVDSGRGRAADSAGFPATDGAGFHASLGAALGSPVRGIELQLPIEAGETLPPIGNLLPVESPLSLDPPAAAGPLPVINTVADETMQEVLAPLDESMVALNSVTEDVLPQDPSPRAPVPVSQLELSEDETFSAGTPAKPAGFDNSLLPVATQPVVPALQESVRRQQPANNGPVLNVQATVLTPDKPVRPLVEMTPVTVAAEPLIAADARSPSSYSGVAASVEFRQLSEKFDAVQKKFDIALSQPNGIAVESAPLPVTGQPARAAAPPLLHSSIPVPLQDDAWGEALGDKVLWMAGKSIQRAEIRLHPATMGPIRIEVSVDDNVTTLSFNAQHAVTREAIEAAMPRLREMLSDNGLSLANSTVSDSDVRHGNPQGGNESLNGIPADAGESEEADLTLTTALTARKSSLLVDTFV